MAAITSARLVAPQRETRRVALGRVQARVGERLKIAREQRERDHQQ